MSNPGRELQALRQPRAVICAECGASFTAVDPRAKFCSNRCRQADKYARAKAARTPGRRGRPPKLAAEQPAAPRPRGRPRTINPG
jgi:hypothetical protein